MVGSQELLVSEQHPTSRRWAIVEDDGVSAWLYLTAPEAAKPVADCWLYNRVPAPPDSELRNWRGGPPPVSASFADPAALMAPPEEPAVRLQWSDDGEAVAVFFGPQLAGFIAPAESRGLSRNLQASGPFGHPLDETLYRALSGPAD
jgi:hypothetical protein